VYVDYKTLHGTVNPMPGVDKNLMEMMSSNRTPAAHCRQWHNDGGDAPMWALATRR
jgi:hypothetical protein